MATLTAELPTMCGTPSRTRAKDSHEGGLHLQGEPRQIPSAVLLALAGADGARFPRLPRRRITW